MIFSTINLILFLQVPKLLITFRLPISPTNTKSPSSIPSILPIATSFQTIMDHINSAKSVENVNDSQLTPRSTYPTHKSTYPYIYHTIKKSIIPSSSIEFANSSSESNKYYAFPESINLPTYSDLSYRQSTPEIGVDYAPAISGSSFNPIASYGSSYPISTNLLGQSDAYPSFASPSTIQPIIKPVTLYGYSGGGNRGGYGGGGGYGHDSDHSSGHSYGHGYQFHHPQSHGHHGHQTVQYIPIPVAVGHHHNEKSDKHKHDITTLVAAIALAAGIPLLLGALLLPLGVLFLLSLATLIAVLTAGGTNSTRGGGQFLARGKRSIGDNNFSFDYDDETVTTIQELIFNSIYNWIISSLE